MTELLCLFAWGFAVGCYGTLVGIGGGPLILPVLAFFYRYDTPTLIATSLFVIFFNTFSGSLAYLKEKRVDIVSGTKFGLATIPGSLVSTFAVYYIHIHVFTFFFGLFLVTLAVYIYRNPFQVLGYEALVRRGKELAEGNPFSRRGSRYSALRNANKNASEAQPIIAGFVRRVIKDEFGRIYKYDVNETLGTAVTAIIGIFSTFLGVGGGFIQVPVLIYLLAFPPHVATATSHYITAINTFFTLIPFVINGDVAYTVAIPLALGAILGAQLGALLSNKIDAETLQKLLVPVFVFMGIKLIFFNS